MEDDHLHAALRHNKMTAPMVIEGAVTGEDVPRLCRAMFGSYAPARAIIHNSDYESIDEVKAAIDRYFRERNCYFKQHPKRAGKKIWQNEPEPAAFSESNNCKALN